MERTTLGEPETATGTERLVRNRLSDAVTATNVAVNHYRVPPGERLAGLHAHENQEEVFVCLDGAITFETLDGAHTLAAGEVVRFAPGEFQSGKNAGEATASVLAIGAPRDTDALRVPVRCGSCDHEQMEPRVRDGETLLGCLNCGHESVVECPECGSDDVRAELDSDGQAAVSACLNCGAT